MLLATFGGKTGFGVARKEKLMANVLVLIVGAGPTGLVFARLTKLGVPVRINCCP
jgi:hypothetical protein